MDKAEREKWRKECVARLSGFDPVWAMNSIDGILIRAIDHIDALEQKPWLERCKRIARSLNADVLDGILPVRAEAGNTLTHLRWMTEEIIRNPEFTETKACRWIGYIHGALVATQLSSLEREKQRNLESAAAPEPQEKTE